MSGWADVAVHLAGFLPDGVTRILAKLDALGQLFVRDAYTGGETLPDQDGADEVLDFTFSAPVQLVYVYGKSASGNLQCRADPFGQVPSAAQGIPCDDRVPVAIPVTASAIKVYAPNGMTVSVWGCRYG